MGGGVQQFGGAAQFGQFAGGQAQGMKRGNATMAGGFGKMQKFGQGAVATTSTGKQLSGFIKSYNTGTGFGFICAQGASGDVFFMKTHLPEHAQENRGLSGQSVRFVLAK